MYNLIMSADEGEWEKSPATVSRSRMFEHTSNGLKSRFASLAGPALQELIRLPCLFVYEKDVEKPARVGRVLSLRQRNQSDTLRVHFELDPEFPPIEPSLIVDLAWELDIGGWELNRTHWAVKDVDLVSELVKAGVVSRVSDSSVETRKSEWTRATATISPEVFRIPSQGQDDRLVSVMRPFQKEFENVQAALRKVCNSLDLDCKDVNEEWNQSEIIHDIFALIYRSRVVICDFTGTNPNVFYEAGIAHTLGRDVIPIVQDEEHMPFDLRHHRYIKYENTAKGLANLSEQVTRRLKTLVMAEKKLECARESDSEPKL